MPVLFDTGILLRLFAPVDPQCALIREATRKLMREGERLVISFQNVAEFHNVSTRPAIARGGYGLDPTTVDSRVRLLERICDFLTESEVFVFDLERTRTQASCDRSCHT